MNWNCLQNKIGDILLFGVFCFMVSCTPPEPFSNTPKITYKDLKYVENERNGFPDSLILSFDFEDGDGDLGLYSYETFYPFHDYEIIVDSLQILDTQNGRFATFRIVTLSEETLIPPLYRYYPQSNVVDLEIFSEDDNRPVFTCEDYDFLRLSFDKTSFLPPATPDTLCVPG